MFYRTLFIIKYIILFSLLNQTFIFANPSEALKWLNQFRQEVKMIPFASNYSLNLAASAHANFITVNNISGHYEKAGKPGFTGATPQDRTIYSGYQSTTVSENVSLIGSSLKTLAHSSIVGLFSAIYHRFGFLTFDKDEVGIGSSNNAYVYNMGNKETSDLCGSSSQQSGWKVCSDGSSISGNDFVKSQENVRKQNPAYVIYPPNGQKDTYPVFFTESPHPLPGSSVSGFPISISFNEYFVDDATVSSIDVFGPDGKKLEGTFMSNRTDPNSKFSSLQYAFFPTLRLAYSSIYNVEIKYSLTPKDTYTGETQGVLKTSFSTEVPKDPMYLLDDFPDNKIPIISGKKYLVYHQPKHSNDLPFARFEISYRGLESQSVDAVDGNVFIVQALGQDGGYLEVSIANGTKIKFYISDTDKAQKASLNGYVANLVSKEPQDASIPIAFKKGWNLLVSPIDKEISNGETGYKMSSFGNDSTIYAMQDKKLIKSPTSIAIGEGFFLNAKQDGSSNSVDGKTYKFTQDIKQGWNLFGLSIASSNLKNDLELEDNDIVFAYKNNKYIKNPTSINTGEGFLIFRK